MVYFTYIDPIKINHSWIGKYTFRPMDGMGVYFEDGQMSVIGIDVAIPTRHLGTGLRPLDVPPMVAASAVRRRRRDGVQKGQVVTLELWDVRCCVHMSSEKTSILPFT